MLYSAKAPPRLSPPTLLLSSSCSPNALKKKYSSRVTYVELIGFLVAKRDPTRNKGLPNFLFLRNQTWLKLLTKTNLAILENLNLIVI